MISPLTRLFVFSRDHFSCIFCGREAPGVELVVIRDLPTDRGGGDDLRNLSTACKACAADKANRTTREYRAFLKERELLLGKLAHLGTSQSEPQVSEVE